MKFCDDCEGVGGQREPAGGEITKTLPSRVCLGREKVAPLSKLKRTQVLI